MPRGWRVGSHVLLVDSGFHISLLGFRLLLWLDMRKKVTLDLTPKKSKALFFGKLHAGTPAGYLLRMAIQGSEDCIRDLQQTAHNIRSIQSVPDLEVGFEKSPRLA